MSFLPCITGAQHKWTFSFKVKCLVRGRAGRKRQVNVNHVLVVLRLKMPSFTDSFIDSFNQLSQNTEHLLYAKHCLDIRFSTVNKTEKVALDENSKQTNTWNIRL